ncbi:S41 family peptidase [Leeuwenhoekiella marinoflava]|uniref:S41 family peptidase n=1 Tax=Leeuwenhoekiella marinoflava TaxID=988 RepID=UPI0030032707
MKNYLLVVLFNFLLFASCSSDDDVAQEVIEETEEPTTETPPLDRADYPVQDFIYQAMNLYYLYKGDIPELADNSFTDLNTYVTYLSQNPDPENFFYDELLSNQDRFSFITDNYVELENSFSGVSMSDGLDFVYAGYQLESSGPVYAAAVIRYVVPNSPASEAGLTRSQVVTQINGERLTVTGDRLSSRAQELLSLDSYTLTLGNYNNTGVLVESDTEVSVNKIELTENPVGLAKTLDIDGQKIGYLLYNSFVRNFDDELNAAFADFKADGVTDLVLDLRYNGGGSVASAIDLASMITGQFEGDVITKQQWNDDLQEIFEERNEDLEDRFNSTIYTGTDQQEAINSLNLNRLYVIGTGSTASASELTIIGLRPYIEVTTIGTTTVGKFQASATLYDGDNFFKENVNPDHTYAIQPLIYTYSNAKGVVGPPTGIEPDFELAEDLRNYGTLGDPGEPLLNLALQQITGKRFQMKRNALSPMTFELYGETGMDKPTYQRMYDNRKLPQIKK